MSEGFSLTASGLSTVGAGAGAGGVGAFRIDIGMIDTRFGARAAAKTFRILLVFLVERGCASRFSFFKSLIIVMCGGEEDWLTEEGDDECMP